MEGFDNVVGMLVIVVIFFLFMNFLFGEGFDILSFSFDVNNVVGMFEGVEGMFFGVEFGLWII